MGWKMNRLTMVEHKRAKEKRAKSNPKYGVVVKKFKTIVYYKSMWTLREGKWLDDEVINFYLQLLKEKAESMYNTMHIFSTYLRTKLLDRNNKKKLPLMRLNYLQVKKWTNKLQIPLWRHRLILAPRHLKTGHWALTAVVTPPLQTRGKMDDPKGAVLWHTIYGLDSLCKYDVCEPHVRRMEQYMAAEYRNKCKKYGIKVPEYRFVRDKSTAPQQHNCNDCGVYVCMMAFCLAFQLPLNTLRTLKHSNMFRKHMALSIAQGELHDLLSVEGLI